MDLSLDVMTIFKGRKIEYLLMVNEGNTQPQMKIVYFSKFYWIIEIME